MLNNKEPIKPKKLEKKKDGEREGSNALSYFDNTFKTLGTMFEIEPFLRFRL